MEDALIPLAGGVVIPLAGSVPGRRGEVCSLEDTCMALEVMLGVTLEAETPFSAEQTYCATERTSIDGRLKVIVIRETGHRWPGAGGLLQQLAGMGKAPTFSAGSEILRMIITDHP